ncbi:MAG TPA: ribosome-recycling factor, partial [Patescibacteria group bacterium]|nr:ribosome-recycling factor [Patescibacteria group bacterium]
MLTATLNKLSVRLEGIKSNFQNELAGLRSNRATPSLVDGVEIEVYGSRMKLRDLAHISCPEPRMIVVQPWDASQVETIAKGLGAAGLGINPAVDGQTIRLPLPPLTEERRGELVRILRAKLEEARVAIRQARQDSVQALERGEKDGQISEDEVKRGEA